MKLRKQFIEEYLDQRFASFTHLCGSYGISCKTDYKWGDRFMDDGLNYLVDKSSAPFRNIIDKYKFVQSMSRKGNYWGNAMTVSFFKTLKSKETEERCFNTIEEV